jgi:transaldolase/glucose-6-phosphate isomerase
MAIAARWQASHFNRPGFELFDYDVYAVCGDGDMMEGISGEAASLAGHLKLSNLCWIYDNNHITIEGNTALATSEDVAVRFLGYGWNVTRVGDANDLGMLTRAFHVFQETRDRPTLIIVDSHIAYGAPNKQDTSAAHGEPLGEEEIRLAKRSYGWPEDAKFLIPDEVRGHYRGGLARRGAELSRSWKALFASYREAFPDLADELVLMQRRELPAGWDRDLPSFPADAKGMAGREASGKVLNVLAQNVPWLVGGSADLTPSTRTRLTFEGAGDFEAGQYGGRNFHFGIREHAMGAVLNGLSLSKVRPYGSGFLIFSDYMRAAVRISALMEIPVIYVFTHDSIGVGEDGPTHQPVEQLVSLRAIPNLVVMRPADANEVTECWRVIMRLRHEPAALVLSRQALPTLDRQKYGPASGVAQGAYVLADASGGEPEVILMATGSEVALCVAAYEQLVVRGVKARVVSMPSWELFERQGPEYRERVLPAAVRARVSVEQASAYGWDRYVGPEGRRIGMHTFGASAPLKELQKKFGFTPEAVLSAAMEVLERAGKKGVATGRGSAPPAGAAAPLAPNSLRALQESGQSVWLDYIRRNLITSGELQRFVDKDGLGGVTSNPSIFEKAITGSTDYVHILKALEPEGLSPEAIFERVAVRDVQDAADLLYPVYQRTRARDGYVSLEVSPYLASQTQATIEAARRLWRVVGRENLMIKVPATDEGIPAIRQLIGEGINVNVTLLFSQAAYERVAEAYLAGLDALIARGGDPTRVASVASFFVSRIDSAVDALLAAKAQAAPGSAALARGLMGKVAVANAKLAYERYKKIFHGDRWERLSGAGAQTQRLLWASTSSKNSAYRDVAYVEALIGPDTVNTVPPATYDAFRDHAHEVLSELERAGISLREVTDRLLEEGVELFREAFDKLLEALGKKKRVAKPKIEGLRFTLPEQARKAFHVALEDWRAGRKVRRLWAADASLWTGSDEASWLGWLGIAESQITHLHELESMREEVARAGFQDALLLGMGGSSLAPEVLKTTYGDRKGHPSLHVLDSTDPAQVRAFALRIDPKKTLFIVSSKSGTTLEPNILERYFFEIAREALGGEAGDHFIAISDPGSKLVEIAERDGFRRIFAGVRSIGGRYSALSNFGMVPAAVMGLDLKRFLDRTEEMVTACASSTPVEDNPGAVLGLLLGTLARAGRDKVTIVSSPGIEALGAWLEQLIAESTGKRGKGLIPVDRERLGPPSVYGEDRVFTYLRLAAAPDQAQDAAVEALRRAGQPVVEIDVEDIHDLGQEFFRWEIATAVAGSVLGINPFDQPDVEASKIATRELTSEYERTGSLPSQTPLLDDAGIRLLTDERNASELLRAAGREKTLASVLRAHLGRLGPGDYLGLLAYLEMSSANAAALQQIRHAVRDARKVATCLGFGPRYLHSTGQAYKGGPNTGVFLQVTCDDAADLSVPGQKYTFGTVKAAQARGDFQILTERGRRALRVHLGREVAAGLATLARAVEQALR